MEEKKVWDETQIRKYDIPLSNVPKYPYNDPKVIELIKNNLPVIITGSDLVKSAIGKWDIEYLQTQMSNCNCNVLFSKNHEFKYYDKKAVRTDLKIKFVPPTRFVNMKISEFVKILEEWEEGDERVYLQQPLESNVGPEMVKDFLKFQWDWLKNLQKTMSWGPLTTNLLLVSMEGNVTPCHYDEQQNLFAQIRGFKRFILFPPEHYEYLYPYPIYHPHDRQSQVDFENPDLEKFPKFKEARGQEAIVGPGDVLYIPICWWHYVESISRGGYTVSINFWHKSASAKTDEYPLQGHQKLTVMRNAEKMLLEVLRDPEELGPLLRAMVLGRYTE